MGRTMKEALEEAGLALQATQVQPHSLVVHPAQEPPRVQKRWWQIFRLPLTTFNVQVLLVVQCDKWEEGMEHIVAHNLNYITTRCKTKEEAETQVRKGIMKWDSEDMLVADQKPRNGALLHWRIYR